MTPSSVQPTPDDDGQAPPESVTRTAVPVRDPAASMALIFDAMRHPVDPLYADAARRRQERGTSDAKPHRSLLLLVTVVLLGLLLGVGAHALRVPSAVGEGRRAQLVSEIERKQTANDAGSREVRQLREDVSAQQSSALSHASRSGLKDDLAAAEKSAGADGVSGPGVTITLDNPAGSDAQSADSNPRTRTEATTLTSTDLQQIVNGLWSSGASAVSVNDQRITSLSAVRFAGSAILVNYRPLTTPYTVKAVGPSDLRARLDAGFAGSYLDTLKSSGFTVHEDAQASVTVPPVAALRLHSAEVMP